MNLDPKITRTLLAILGAAVAAIVAFNVLTREHGDPARHLIERETAAPKPQKRPTPEKRPTRGRPMILA